MKRTIYLDHAAATPIDTQVLAAMQPYFSENFYNPSASYLAARTTRQKLDQARAGVAAAIGVRPVEVVFTAGGTEANNLALIGITQSYPAAHMVTTALEHDSVRAPAAWLELNGWHKTEIKPAPNGVINPQSITNAITDTTVLVSVMYANNEIGTIQPIRHIAAEINNIREHRRRTGNNLPIYLHTDACQAPNYASVQVHRLGVDMMTLNGGKMYGPKQSGMLFVGSHVRLKPIIHGGGQERNRRSGTENVAASIGFSQALMIAQASRKSETTRLQQLQRIFMEELVKQLPQCTLNGSVAHRLANNVHITIPTVDNERLLYALDQAGIQCAAGSACSASKDETSHTLKSIGLTDEQARASLRFTMGRSTTQADVLQTVATLAKLVA